MKNDSFYFFMVTLHPAKMALHTYDVWILRRNDAELPRGERERIHNLFFSAPMITLLWDELDIDLMGEGYTTQTSGSWEYVHAALKLHLNPVLDEIRQRTGVDMFWQCYMLVPTAPTPAPLLPA